MEKAEEQKNAGGGIRTFPRLKSGFGRLGPTKGQDFS